MNGFYTTDSEGISHLAPTSQGQRELLEQLMQDPGAIGDIWLAHTESGWAINVFPSGLVQLERPGKEVRELGPLGLAKVLELWGWLAKGELQQIEAQPWRLGTPR
ncbi:MAG: hypothetical protein ACFB21_00950 [Opitutales bacterium]